MAVLLQLLSRVAVPRVILPIKAEFYGLTNETYNRQV